MANEKPITIPQSLTAKEAAKVLRRSERTLANWRHSGKGPVYISVGDKHSMVIYPLDELVAYLAAHTVRPVEAA